MDNIQVELVNKEECKEFFKKWGIFSSECYATPEGREEVVGKHCYKTGHYSGSRSFSFVFKVKGVSRACYDEETEILTKDGWKLFKDIDNDEIVATMNLDTNTVEFNKINEKIEYNYTGDIHFYNSQNVDLCVTSNHNMLIKKFDVKKPDNFKLLPSENIKVNRVKMTKRFNYDKEINDTITIKGFEYTRKNNLGIDYKKKTEDLTFNRKTFYKFMAWYLSDGCVTYDKNENKYVISISQTPCDKNIKNGTIDEIMSIIRDLGFNPRYDSNRYIKFNNMTLGKFLKELGLSYQKYIPLDIFDSFNKEYAKEFIETYLKGDGGIDNNGCGKLYTTSKKLADQLQILCFIAGYSAKIISRDDRGETTICGKKVNVNHIHYNVNISMSNKRNIEPQITLSKHLNVEKVINKKVYCVNVPNHIIFVRRNGICIWCGNCTAQMNRSSVGVTINEKSMRYVDFSNAVIKIPPTIEGNEKAKEIFLDASKYVLNAYKELQDILAEDGITGEKSNQDCRYILPLGTETSAVYGYTLEALENFMNNRLCSRSQWEIRKVATLMRDEVLDVLPELKDKLVPRCEKLMWCPEGKGCCGRKPTKEQLKNKLNNQ